MAATQGTRADSELEFTHLNKIRAFIVDFSKFPEFFFVQQSSGFSSSEPLGCQSVLHFISSQIELTVPQSFQQLLRLGFSPLIFPPLLQELHRRFLQVCGVPFGNRLQLGIAQAQFAAQFTPIPSQVL